MARVGRGQAAVVRSGTGRDLPRGETGSERTQCNGQCLCTLAEAAELKHGYGDKNVGDRELQRCSSAGVSY